MRRRVLIATSAALWLWAGAFGNDVTVPGSAARGTDWPRYLGPTLDGKSAETGLLLEWPDSGPPVRWQRPIGEGYSMPSVADGRLFTFDRHRDQARLTCLLSETGKELWHVDYPTDYQDVYGFSNGPRTTPVVDEDRVYTFGVEGRLRCHRVRDGSLLWEHDTAKRFGVTQNFFGVGSTPIVEGDLLIVHVGGSPPGSPDIHSGRTTGNGSAIVAFDKRTGEVRYQLSDELASYASPTIATVDGRRRGFLFARGGLLGFDPIAGTLDFRFPWRARRLQTVNASNPTIIDDLVFLSEAYGPGSVLLRLKEEGEPEVVWKDPPRGKTLETHWMTPIYHEGVLYASSGSGSGEAELRAVEFLTGKIYWREPGLGRSTLLYVDSHLIVLTEFGTLLVVRATPEGFQPVSRTVLELQLPASNTKIRLLKQPAWNPPILSRGLLYVRGKDRLVCLDLRGHLPATPGAAE